MRAKMQEGALLARKEARKAFAIKAILLFAAAALLRSLQTGRAARQLSGLATIGVQICRIGCG